MTSLALAPTNKKEKTDKAVAVLITLLIHGGILLFLLLYIIYTPIPPYPAPPGGPELELDFGNGINGTGNVEASNIGNSTSKDSKATSTAANATKDNPVVTNDVENSTTINNSKTVAKTPVKVDTVKPQPQVDVQLASALQKFKGAKGSTGGNGNSGQQGNAGSPNGTNPGTSMGTGNGPGGTGKGFAYDLSGRQLVLRPKLVTNNPEQGEIVVGITVDQDGNVTEAIPGVRGSTITDAPLYELVKEAALKIKFNKSTDGSPEQMGTVTFRFTIQ